MPFAVEPMWASDRRVGNLVQPFISLSKLKGIQLELCTFGSNTYSVTFTMTIAVFLVLTLAC